MCNHDETKTAYYLSFLDFPGYEIYMCECGALIDIANLKNYGDPVHPMTPDEIQKLMNDVFAPIKKFSMGLQSLEQTEKILNTRAHKA